MREQTQQQDQMTKNDKEEELRTLKLAYEKMVTVKDKEIKELEELMANKSRSEVRHVKNYILKWNNNDQISLSQNGEENRVQSIVSQHQKEIKVLQTQFQQLLDLKDKELEGFSYRLKTVTTSQQKDLEKINEEHRQKLTNLDAECQKKEESLKSKALEMRWMAAEFESSEVKNPKCHVFTRFGDKVLIISSDRLN